MNSRTIWLFVGGALLGGGALAGEAVEPSDALLESMRADAIRGHIAFLADDLLEGRGTGSRGYAIAARYVATQLEGIGLEPAGASGTFEQPVPLRRVELISEECSLTVIQGGSETELKISADYIMGGRPEATSTEVEAEVVFVGFGVTADGYDDYTDIDVRGKIVAMFRGAPAEFPLSEARPLLVADPQGAQRRRPRRRRHPGPDHLRRRRSIPVGCGGPPRAPTGLQMARRRHAERRDARDQAGGRVERGAQRRLVRWSGAGLGHGAGRQ